MSVRKAIKYKLLRASPLLLFLSILYASLAAIAQAQASPAFENLIVELWPEYDRPEVLVIYRAELSSETSLPTQLTFRLPGYIENMHAVAVEQNGVLVDVNPETIELLREEDNLILTFPTPSRKVHVEYYDPVILTKADQNRQLVYRFSAPYPIETATFEVQEPFRAEDFSLTPRPGSTFIGNNGLRYDSIQVTKLTTAETFELSATYKRDTTEVSTQLLADNTSSQSPGISVVAESPINENLNVGYLLIGVGVLLLLGTGGYWWWLRKMREDATPGRRPPTRPVRRKEALVVAKPEPARRRRETTESTSPPLAGYCYRCGTALREDAQFCHVCGAERRRE